MNIKDDLLRDAIADAKAVRETALANAKLAITEAFAPRIQSMLSTAIQNENDMETDEFSDDMNMGDPTDSGFGESQGSPVSTDPMAAAATAPAPMASTPAPFESAPAAAPVQEDEFSLENIIRELEQEASAADTMNDPFVAENNETEEPTVDEAAGSTSFASADNKKPSPKSSKAQTEDPQGSIKPNYPKAKTGDKYLSEDINLEQLIRELKEEFDGANIEENETEAELEEVKADLKEHREVIQFLRARLNEVNLLNSKLLFTNLLLKNHSLNEAQKYKVVESLDRATTIKESKLVYSTLEEAFTSTKGVNSPAKRIVESMASKNVGSTKPSEETQKTILNEGSELTRRFQKLAGIIK